MHPVGYLLDSVHKDGTGALLHEAFCENYGNVDPTVCLKQLVFV